MLERIKDIINLVSLITLYPEWIKILLLIYALLSIIVLFLLIQYYPAPSNNLEILDGRTFQSLRNEHGLNIELRLKNMKTTSVELTGVTLTMFDKERTTGVSLNSSQITGRYWVAMNPDIREASVNQNNEEAIYDVPFYLPYGDPGYILMTLPIAQTVPPDKSDRIQLFIGSRLGMFSNIKKIKVNFHYDKDQETDSYLISIKK